MCVREIGLELVQVEIYNNTLLVTFRRHSLSPRLLWIVSSLDCYGEIETNEIEFLIHFVFCILFGSSSPFCLNSKLMQYWKSLFSIYVL